jgi:hypothetical protein
LRSIRVSGHAAGSSPIRLISTLPGGLCRRFQQPRAVTVGDDFVRDLADYDRVLGIIDGGFS